jgi:hypothetical protein
MNLNSTQNEKGANVRSFKISPDSVKVSSNNFAAYIGSQTKKEGE